MKAFRGEFRFGAAAVLMSLIFVLALSSASMAQSNDDDFDPSEPGDFDPSDPGDFDPSEPGDFDTSGPSDYSSGPASLPEFSGTGIELGMIIQGEGPVIERVERIGEVCSAVPIQNRIHCLAYQYQALESQLPQTAAYYDMRLAIGKAARDLRRLASENFDPDAPLARVPRVADRAPSLARQQVPAVRQDRLEEAARAAEVILEETATVLLRSAENSRNRSVAYQRVAEAIDSSKVLLRSG